MTNDHKYPPQTHNTTISLFQNHLSQKTPLCPTLTKKQRHSHFN